MRYFTKILLVLILILFISDCKKKEENQNTEEPITKEEPINDLEETPPTREEIKNPSLPSPATFRNIAEAKGDLDGDEIPELVVVYDTAKQDELGTQRELHIFKKKEDNWNLLHKSIGVVLPSMAGGMMLDPFENVTIENGAIVLHHFGGAREKWSYTHKFRFQKEGWYLIGATIEYSIVCEESTSYDYNVSTGKVNMEYTKESCDTEGNAKGKPKVTKSSFALKEKQSIQMDGFVPGNTEAKLSKNKTFYF